MHSTRTRRSPLAALLLAVAAIVAASLVGIEPASADHGFAPEDTATITPGVMMYTEGAQCTANFIFSDDAGAHYIGYAAHCAGTGGATSTNGCDTTSLPLGTEVEIEGASQPGTLAYSSWQTMQDVGETDANTCQYNDFALVEIDPADHDSVNPTIPVLGGPNGLGETTSAGESVYSYGNSSLRAGIELLSPKQGVSLGATADGWTHPVYTVTPGIPGDSGSGFLDGDGNAVGVLSTLQLAPLAASNGVSDLDQALDYLNANSDLSSVTLEAGTSDFTGSALPVVSNLLGG